MANARFVIEGTPDLVNRLISYKERHGVDAFIADVNRGLNEGLQMFDITFVSKDRRIFVRVNASPFLSGLIAAHGVSL